MCNRPIKTFLSRIRILTLFLSVCLVFSCTNDNSDNEEDFDTLNPIEEGGDGENSCTNKEDYVFIEKEGLLLVEFENAKFSGEWELKSNGDGFTGDGYMMWNGPQYLNEPGNGYTVFKIKIENSGTYQFLWKSAVTVGNNGTEHNDTWLRFSDADDFFAKKGTSIVYPKGSGKTPNPEGATKDGWFKIYRSGNDSAFDWQAFTYDNNAHEIYITFDKTGSYTMEISARSSGHGIDKFVLFKAPYTKEDVTTGSNPLSGISCN